MGISSSYVKEKSHVRHLVEVPSNETLQKGQTIFFFKTSADSIIGTAFTKTILESFVSLRSSAVNRKSKKEIKKGRFLRDRGGLSGQVSGGSNVPAVHRIAQHQAFAYGLATKPTRLYPQSCSHE